MLRTKINNRKRTRIIVLIAVCLLVIVGAGLSYYIWSNRTVIDASVLKEADFPVYTARTLPEGYQVAEKKTQLSGSVLSYAFASQDGEGEIAVTVQPRPSGFNMSRMTEGGSVKSTSVNQGTLYDLSVGGSTRYLLDTDEALIFLTSNSHIDTATITKVANSLERYN